MSAKMCTEDIQDALKTLTGIFPEQVTAEILREAKCEMYMMPLPEGFDARISHLGNALVQVCNGVRGKDQRLIIDIKTLASALSYLLNSTSFREGEYFGFDRDNVDKRLGRK